MTVRDRERFKEIIAESYNIYADLYEKKKRLQTVNLNNLLTIMTKCCGHSGVLPSGSYLDVGCGTGNLFSILEQISEQIGGYSYVGVDIASEMIRVAKDTYSKGDFRVGDAEHLVFEDASFDFVISNSVMHWLNNPSIGVSPKRALSECLRVLKRDGKLGVSVAGVGTARRFQRAYKSVIQWYFNSYVGHESGISFRSDPIGSMNLYEVVDMLLDVGFNVYDARLTYEPVIYRNTLDYVQDVRAYGFGPYMSLLKEDVRESVWTAIANEFVSAVGRGPYIHDQYMIYVVCTRS